MKQASSRPDGPRHAPMKQATAPASHKASHSAAATVSRFVLLFVPIAVEYFGLSGGRESDPHGHRTAGRIRIRAFPASGTESAHRCGESAQAVPCKLNQALAVCGCAGAGFEPAAPPPLSGRLPA